MRPRAGDPPRTMPQKVLAGRADDPKLGADLVKVKVDQVVLARDPNRSLGEALDRGLKKAAVELAIAYDTRCVTTANGESRARVSRSVLQQSVLVARPGIGFPPAVHLERFASPARLAITDEPRMLSVGGIGMLAMLASPAQLAETLNRGHMLVRPPRSIQVLLSGKLRPFVCVRDVALELIRRGLGEAVRKIDQEHGAPVVIEFAGSSARLLGVPDRSLLCSLAPSLGAAGAVFVSDEKTEVYLRDQRRSKAHRALVPDPGAPCDDVISVDLSAVDPLVQDETGAVRPVRELSDRAVRQVVLGGDCGASLRDLLAAAALLKSKRVPPLLDLLIAPPSRQVLEVLAKSGALVDLIATGARIIEPDQRVVTGELYPPPDEGVSLRTFDPEPGTPESERFVVGSAETLAYAVASGKIGDPRSFKRPVRVTVPRSLPTDDVLIVRKGKGKGKVSSAEALKGAPPKPPKPNPWHGETKLSLVKGRVVPDGESAILLRSLNDVRWVARRAPSFGDNLRAVIAEFIPTAHISTLAGLGVAALTGDAEAIEKLEHEQRIALPAPGEWNGEAITVAAGKTKVDLKWVAVGAEREWTTHGTVPPAPAKPAKK